AETMEFVMPRFFIALVWVTVICLSGCSRDPKTSDVQNQGDKTIARTITDEKDLKKIHGRWLIVGREGSISTGSMLKGEQFTVTVHPVGSSLGIGLPARWACRA